MRHGKRLAVAAALLLAGCSSPESLKDMVGYVPPTSLPAQPKRTLVADPRDQVWAELVRFLESSNFDIDHIDSDENLIVARYSGDPEPYVDCGSIVTHQGGTLGQISGSATEVALNYAIDDSPVVLNRNLNLDSRIIIRLSGQPQGTVIQTDTTYVVTKIVDVIDPSGAVREGSRETVSFQAGKRGEFSKGTACQPNGSLHLAVLQSLPNIVGSDDIDRAQLDDAEFASVDQPIDSENAAIFSPEVQEETTTVSPAATVESTRNDLDAVDGLDAAAPPPLVDDDDWVLPDQGLPAAALPRSETQQVPSSASPGPTGSPPPGISPDDSPASAVVQVPPSSDAPDEPENSGATVTAAVPNRPTDDNAPVASTGSDTIVDETTRKLLESLDCGGDEWHFCDLVTLTTPYRKRNIEKLYGLTINTTESFTSQIVGRDLKLDVLFPSFPSHLHIVYARRDGMIEHVSPSSDVWPANLAHQMTGSDLTIPGPEGLAMIIAVASKEPLFPAVSDDARTEDAKTYIERLSQRLAQLEGDDPEGQVVASQLLIYVENAGS